MRKLRLLLLACFLMVASPSASSGQVVRGQIESGEGEWVEGVLVLALDSVNALQATRITGSDGTFLLTLPFGGAWTVRAERIGFGIGERKVFLNQGDTLELNIQLDIAPVPVEGLEVAPGPRCPNASASPGVAKLWMEARQVLTSVAQVESQGTSRFQVTIRRRDYRPGGFGPEFIANESEDTVTTSGAVPMQSASPEYLVREGFIVAEDDTASYYAPDANVLLSDEFLTTHCFLRRDHPNDDRYVGLGFEPTNPSRLDIRGTFWLPSDPGGFPYIEFEWTTHPWVLMEVTSPGTLNPTIEPANLDSRVGGQVDLSFLSEVGWIVHKWWMRWPVPVELKTDQSDLPPGFYLGLIREWQAELVRAEIGQALEPMAR